MRLLLQRVSHASVTVDTKTVASIGAGYVVFLGVVKEDNETAADWLAQKILSLKLFNENGSDILQKKGDILVVSQFTLAARIESGTKPDFGLAAKAEDAKPLYDSFVGKLRSRGVHVETGVFGASMKINLINDGPYTLWLQRGETA